MTDLVVASSPKSLISEGFRTLRTNLQFSAINGKLRTLAVVSSMQSEGKSFTSANLACAFAQAGEKVLLIDCDMRRGRLHTIFNVSVTIVLLPLSKYLVKLVNKILPGKDPMKHVGALYLDKKLLETPIVATGQVFKETIRMGEIAKKNVELAMRAL